MARRPSVKKTLFEHYAQDDMDALIMRAGELLPEPTDGFLFSSCVS
jgi:hypothetical protein